MVGMVRRAVLARVVAGGTDIRETMDPDITDFFSQIRAHPGNPWFYPVATLNSAAEANVVLANKKAQARAWA